jgi:hypothetical protein
MIDERILPVLEEDFTSLQILEMKSLLKDAKTLGGWDLEVAPQTLFENQYCSVCATFYSREVAELWLSRSGKEGKGKPFTGEKIVGFRVCIDFTVTEEVPFWPGW